MGTNTTYDLTGVNELFYEEGIPGYIIQDDQVFELTIPLFEDGLEIYEIGTTNNLLVKDTDWTITATDYDTQTMSTAKLADVSFAKKLIKSITFIKPFYDPYEIVIKGQRFYIDLVNAIVKQVDPIELTPELIYQLSTDVATIKALINPTSDTASITTGSLQLLAEDRECELSGNIISDEVHTVNVPSGRAVIHPVNGAFFRDTESIVTIADNETLVRDVDYVVQSCDITKTKLTNYLRGVYKTIVLTRSIVGDVKVSYHAFGGGITANDIRNMSENFNNLIEYIRDTKFLSTENVGSAPIVTELINRMATMEATMRRLSTDGQPTYADKADRTAVLQKLNFADSNLHWFNIAYLYKVDGSDTIQLIDRAQLRVRTVQSGLMFDVMASVNLIDETFTVEHIADLNPKAYVPYTDFTNLNNQIIPQFRMIYNENETERSGAFLQIGLSLPEIAQETIAIEDLSGKESCFILLPELADAKNPDELTVTLPNTDHIWDPDNVDSRILAASYPNKDGYIAFAGSIGLSTYASPVETAHFLKTAEISNLRRVIVEMDHTSGNKITAEGLIDYTTHYGSVVFPADTSYGNLNFTFTQDSDKMITMTIGSDYLPANHGLTLRHVLVNFA